MRRFLPVLFALTLLAGCRRPTRRAATPLRPPAAAAPAGIVVDAEGISHSGYLVPAGGVFAWDLPAGAGDRLRFDWTSPGARGDVALVMDQSRIVRKAGDSAHSPILWSEDVPFSTRRPARLRIHVEPAGALFLSDVRVVRPDPGAPAAVLIVFDTTRHDAVGFGGCIDPSTPHLDAILARAWKAPRAYAAASWTIPSMASLLTGRVPAVQEDADGSPLGIVANMPTLADDFRRAGWSTAAFVANPTLRRENGFASGFDVFFTTPHEGASITLPGRETMRRVPAWLAAHRGEPFFAWIHLMDPHDPYTPYDRPRGKTPFDPDYTGPIVGDEVNRLQLGDPPPPSRADVRHLVALYHDEVRLADAEIAKLWDAQPAVEKERWTIVFTSDHGEEFGEHGGWKHGPALFEETLRVPLAIRAGTGRALPAIPKAAFVSLLDVRPTLAALLGLARPKDAGEGVNLLDPAAANRAALPLPVVTMLTGGAPRAAVLRPASALLFFDRLGTRGVPDPAADPQGFRLAKRLPQILPALVRFDLTADPRETKPLPVDVSTFPDDWRAIEGAMAHTRRGLEVRFTGSGPVAVRIGGLPRTALAEPFALEEEDRLSWSRTVSSAELTARLDPSDGVDGVLLADLGAGAGEASIRLQVDSAPGGCAAVVLNGARSRTISAGGSETLPIAAIPTKIPRFQTPSGCAGLFLWRAEGGARVRSSAEEEEQRRKLRALGYLH
ncbi:MAG TPA: sulfatase-like hydrolase/transferase [Thermoanaerobaculia bacterium]